jgi:hypothetical protein
MFIGNSKELEMITRSIKHLVLGLGVLSCGLLTAVEQKKPQQMLAQKSNASQKNNKEMQDVDATFCLPESGGTAMAEFLWWSTNYNLPFWVEGSQEKSTSQISTTPNVTLDANRTFAQVIRTGQKWSPGVRLSLGYVPGYDFMDLQFRWTYYENHAHGSGKATPLTVGIGSNNNTGGIAGCKVSLQLVENVADFELAKSYFTGSKVLLRPFCGVRAAWLHQNHHAFYQGKTFVNPQDGFTIPGGDLPLHIKLKQNFWSVGPRIGLNTSWFKYCGLSVLANISTSLLYGKAHQAVNVNNKSAKENNNSGSAQTQESTAHIVAHDKFWEIFPELQLMLGASWERCITRDLSVKLFASWEANFWWEASNILFFDRALSTEGLTAGIGLTF